MANNGRKAARTPVQNARRRSAHRAPPNTLTSEEALLGNGMRSTLGADLAAALRDAFYTPRHSTIAHAISRLRQAGVETDATTVASELGDELEEMGGPSVLVDLLAKAPPSSTAPHHARIVERDARARRVLALSSEISERIYAGESASGLITQLGELELQSSEIGLQPGPDLVAFLSVVEEEHHDWVVRDLIERSDRVILIGSEGHGKSTLLRQFGVQCASGIHPFELTVEPPIRVTQVDLENSERHMRRALRPLQVAAGESYSDERLRIEHRPEGVDLTSPAGAAWLDGRMTANAPELLTIGPLYKMAIGDPTAEEDARRVAFVLDQLRTKHRCAVLIEGHMPYGTSAGHRPKRPYGASLWSRWPELGLMLGGNGELTHWRPPRDERAWPSLLKRGGAWPWTVEHHGPAVTFAKLLVAQRDADHKLTTRELEMITGIPKSTIARAIEANRLQFDAALEDVE